MGSSLFDEFFKEVAVPVLQEQRGRTVLYLEHGGEPVTLTAQVHAITLDERNDESGRYRHLRRVIEIEAAALAAPKPQATVDIDGLDWSIVTIGDTRGGLTPLNLERIETVERSRPGYRQHR